MRRLKEIEQYLKHQDYLNLIIISNLVLFLLAQILIAFNAFSLRFVALPYDFDKLGTHWWTVLTYGFFHQGLLALFFNMLLLFYFGSILLDFKSEKVLVQVYGAGLLFGALFFELSYRFFSDFYVFKGSLLGASAGVMAVMTYISLLMPQYQIKIRFLGFFKLIHILILVILFNLLQIPLGNPGGYFAHLGGLTAGFIFFLLAQQQKIRQQNALKSKIQQPAKVKNKIDPILDKISRSGYDSLTQAEKDELFKQSQK